jgi:hypothetical protein
MRQDREELLKRYTESITTGKDSFAEIRQKQEEEKAKRRERGVISEHLSLEETEKLDRARRRQHPTTGSTRSIPDRWSTTGTIKKPGQDID